MDKDVRARIEMAMQEPELPIGPDVPQGAAESPLEKRIGVIIALAAAGGLHLVLAPNLSVGPTWAPLASVLVLMFPTWLAGRAKAYRLVQILGHTISGILTFFMIASVGLLVATVLAKEGRPSDLLRSAAALWITNILVFASWYWRLDAGGPEVRHRRQTHHVGSFFFPQMGMSAEIKACTGQTHWKPGFIDYLFLSFCTSTALSPADTAALSRWAKVLMMLQALVSLAVIVLLAARAVNML